MIVNDTLKLKFSQPKNPFRSFVLVANYGNNANDIALQSNINFQKDYFTPANGLTFVIENANVNQLVEFLQRGWSVEVYINDKLNMIGYIFDYKLSYDHSGGTTLRIECQDLLHYMAQGTVLPNLGINQVTNFHFSPNDTLRTALKIIAATFTQSTSAQDVQVLTDDSASLTFASGFAVGVKTLGKTPKSRQTSLNNNLNHLTTPMKGESYLAYMTRLAKMAGCNIKMHNSKNNTIIVKPPTYLRSAETPFKLYHYTSAPRNSLNNVKRASYNFSLDSQPSVVIIEANTTGDGRFHQSTIKGTAINELSAYPLVDLNQSGIPDPVNSVSDTILALTSGSLGVGYDVAPFNQDLYNIRYQLSNDIDTTVCLPFYQDSANAHSVQECTFAASKLLAECQDRAVEFIFEVQGWSQNGYVWQPDMMVEVYEELFNKNSFDGTKIDMWIRRVNFMQDRAGGTMTQITCTLPFTHNFEISGGDLHE